MHPRPPLRVCAETRNDFYDQSRVSPAVHHVVPRVRRRLWTCRFPCVILGALLRRLTVVICLRMRQCAVVISHNIPQRENVRDVRVSGLSERHSGYALQHSRWRLSRSFPPPLRVQIARGKQQQHQPLSLAVPRYRDLDSHKIVSAPGRKGGAQGR